jgi:cobalt-zinc-cadmium efflux system outer membrane protein
MQAIMIRPHQWLLLGAGLSLAPLLAAQHQDHPDHAPLVRVETLAFDDILAAALQHDPSAIESPVRAQQAEDYVAAGNSWIAAPPQLVYNGYHDGPLDSAGQREYQYGVQLPLRRPGEFGDAREQGERYQQQVSAWENSLRWQLAGSLRMALATIEIAETQLHLQEQAVATASSVHEATQRLFDAGAVARLDVLQAENLLLTEQQALLQAEAALVDAEREYVVLTGMQQRPVAPHREQLSALEDIGEQHPLIGYLQTEVAVAASNVRQNEIANKGNPQLMVGTRRERGDRFAPWIDTVAVSVSIPVGGKSFVSSRTSQARREQADAEVDVLATRRELQRSLHEAEHELYVTRQALPLAAQQAQLGEQRSTMARSAFEAGETNLTQVLLAVQEAARVQREYSLLQLQEQHLITEYNHFAGVLP